jgi:N-acetylglucosaminyldiphosphoundecaprenol N-acetyl-beta-D-mannosaminyltransferase
LAGVPVDSLSRQEAFERCRMFLNENKLHHIVTVNPEFVVEAQNNPEFLQILRSSDLAVADGVGICVASRVLFGVKRPRISGVDLMVDICGLAAETGASVFFLGARNGAAFLTARMMQTRFTGLNVAGSSEDERIDAAQLQKTDILFVAFGAPNQELWIARNLSKLPNLKIAMGVGGAFDYISGNKKRAPQYMRKLGFEWMWRLAREPRRMPRTFNATVKFPALVLREAMRGARS